MHFLATEPALDLIYYSCFIHIGQRRSSKDNYITQRLPHAGMTSCYFN